MMKYLIFLILMIINYLNIYTSTEGLADDDEIFEILDSNNDQSSKYTSTEEWAEDDEIFEILDFDNHQISKYTSREGWAEEILEI